MVSLFKHKCSSDGTINRIDKEIVKQGKKLNNHLLYGNKECHNTKKVMMLQFLKEILIHKENRNPLLCGITIDGITKIITQTINQK